MSTTNNNKNNNKKNNNKPASVIVPMRQAIIRMHNCNNNKAISKDFAAGCGVSDKAFTAWCGWVETLRVKLEPYVQKFNDHSITDDDMNKIFAEAMPVYRQIIRVDECNDFHKKMFARDTDIYKCLGFLATYGASVNGSVEVLRSKIYFRKQVETMIGIRLAANDLLSEDEYDIMTKYEKNVLNVEKANNRIYGYDKDGKHVDGLEDQLTEAKAKKKEAVDMAKSFGVAEQEIENHILIVGFNKTITDIENSLKSNKESLKKSSDYVKNNKAKYNAIVKAIGKLEA